MVFYIFFRCRSRRTIPAETIDFSRIVVKMMINWLVVSYIFYFSIIYGRILSID